MTNKILLPVDLSQPDAAAAAISFARRSMNLEEQDALWDRVKAAEAGENAEASRTGDGSEDT